MKIKFDDDWSKLDIPSVKLPLPAKVADRAGTVAQPGTSNKQYWQFCGLSPYICMVTKSAKA